VELVVVNGSGHTGSDAMSRQKCVALDTVAQS
jgi:hypothetical protein